jgi:hypothetical protein
VKPVRTPLYGATGVPAALLALSLAGSDGEGSPRPFLAGNALGRLSSLFEMYQLGTTNPHHSNKLGSSVTCRMWWLRVTG